MDPPPLPPSTTSSTESATLRAEVASLQQRLQRSAQIEDDSIRLKCRVEDLERQLMERDHRELRNLRENSPLTKLEVNDEDVEEEDDLEAGSRRPLLSSTLLRIPSSSPPPPPAPPHQDANSSSSSSFASTTLVRQKATAVKNLARFFCGVDQPNLKRAVAAAKRMPLIFWTYMILIHFFWFRCILAEFVFGGGSGGGGAHGGL